MCPWAKVSTGLRCGPCAQDSVISQDERKLPRGPCVHAAPRACCPHRAFLRFHSRAERLTLINKPPFSVNHAFCLTEIYNAVSELWSACCSSSPGASTSFLCRSSRSDVWEAQIYPHVHSLHLCDRAVCDLHGPTQYGSFLPHPLRASHSGPEGPAGPGFLSVPGTLTLPLGLINCASPLSPASLPLLGP